MLLLERKRTERSRKSFLLMMLNMGEHPFTDKLLRKVASALSRSTRETDFAGWYEDHSVVGVIFTGIALSTKEAIVSVILTRIQAALSDNITPEQLKDINVSFHVFPEEWTEGEDGRRSNPKFYPDLLNECKLYKAKCLLKRLVDIGGSLLALLILSPLFLIIAVAVRLSSEGPVLFRQPRLGQYGVPFDLLKFRSMQANNDASIHKDYVTHLVAGTAPRQPANSTSEGVYKLTNDPRVTRLGALLRRSSLDELPQLINVLKGEMSLVGPRPPLAYEVDVYDLWHRRRLVETKPGITGLWQVSGRNRIAFDDMVRLDLRYARTWSVWLDLKILLRTPLAVIEGAH